MLDYDADNEGICPGLSGLDAPRVSAAIDFFASARHVDQPARKPQGHLSLAESKRKHGQKQA
jgi:hypothetical protein